MATHSDLTQSAMLHLACQEAVQAMVHDLRSPISVVKANLQIMLSGMLGELSADHRMLVERSITSLDELVWLTDTVLQAGQLQDGRVLIKPIPVDLDRMIQEAVDFYQVPFQQRDMRLFRDGNTSGMFLHVDPLWIKRVVHNLIWNAYKFTPDHGQVSLQVRHAGGGLDLLIEDNGRGVPADKLEQIFGKFSQTHHAMDRKLGSGLGLWICRKVMEEHGGSIRCESPAGNGSRFILHFPSHRIL